MKANLLKNTAIIAVSIALASCTSVKEIGDLNRATSLDNAIDNVVKQTPGGEFVKNVKVYIVNKKYFAVEGDIWGLQSGQNMRGYTLGSKVQYPCGVSKCIGKITDLTNDKVCQVKNDETGKVTTEKYSDLKKAE